jgi:adenylate kinase family enzyme
MTADLSTPPQKPMWIAVIGPPAVGKTSLADALAQALSARVFAWRAFARTRRAQRLPAEVAVDPRGEYADAVVDELLRDAFLHGGFPAFGRPVILPGFPVTVAHLVLLHSVARTRGVPLRVLEIDAINGVLMARAYHRRLCLACRPDPDGEPHDIASADPRMPTRCDVCAGPLAIRCADRQITFVTRLAQYREQRPAMWAAAYTARIPWAQVNAASSAAAASLALRLLAVPAADVLRSRDLGPADGVPRQRSGSSNRPDPP